VVGEGNPSSEFLSASAAVDVHSVDVPAEGYSNPYNVSPVLLQSDDTVFNTVLSTLFIIFIIIIEQWKV